MENKLSPEELKGIEKRAEANVPFGRAYKAEWNRWIQGYVCASIYERERANDVMNKILAVINNNDYYSYGGFQGEVTITAIITQYAQQ